MEKRTVWREAALLVLSFGLVLWALVVPGTKWTASAQHILMAGALALFIASMTLPKWIDQRKEKLAALKAQRDLEYVKGELVLHVLPLVFDHVDRGPQEGRAQRYCQWAAKYLKFVQDQYGWQALRMAVLGGRLLPFTIEELPEDLKDRLNEAITERQLWHTLWQQP